MTQKFNPLLPSFPHLLHGADYNPEQWKAFPEIIDEDFRLFGEAGVNTVSIGIFSWAELEPEEGKYDFTFFDGIMDRLAARGMKAFFATPSAGKPHWLARKYPDVLPMDQNGKREARGGRLGFCKSSPDFREKIALLNTALAKHYAGHPALGAWHVCNEITGVCCCPRCRARFTEWLKKKYGTLDAINAAYWNGFWGHTYRSWEDIELSDGSVHALALDWKRFCSDLIIDYLSVEIAPLRQYSPEIPVTTNYMQYASKDYRKIAKLLDFVSWDSYPAWHSPGEGHRSEAVRTAFWHDRFRTMGGGKPFALMECTPSQPSWADFNKLKKPGMHRLAALQAIAHGSDTVQYFQWRKSRGGYEKFHGAVVDHYGGSDTRVFSEVAEVGKELAGLGEIVGTKVVSRAAVMFDTESGWALDLMKGGNKKKDYEGLCLAFYRVLWERGISADVIESADDLQKYDLVLAPALYMVSEETIEKLCRFVSEGGTLVSTAMTGWADENDLCYLGGFPGGKLKELFGIRAEEMDSLYPSERNKAVMKKEVSGLKKPGDAYEAAEYCELLRPLGAEVLAEYGEDFYSGSPALTVNRFGKGRAFYIAFKNGGELYSDLVSALSAELSLPRALGTSLPRGVTASVRTDGENSFVFLQNFGDAPAELTLGAEDGKLTDPQTGEEVTGTVRLDAYGVRILKKQIQTT